MSKRVLIIGTSHSQAVCQDSGKEIETYTDGRWFDYLYTEYGAEVFKLARSGATAEEQLIAVYNYFKTNPSEKFDFCIVEGRSVQVGVSSPQRQILGFGDEDFDFKNSLDINPYVYNSWTDDYINNLKKHGPEYTKHFTFADRIDTHGVDSKFVDKPYLTEWMIDYTMSYLHSIHIWSTNRTMIEFLKNYCDEVKWFSFDCHGDLVKRDPETGEILDDIHPYNIMADDFIGNYYLFDDPINNPFIDWQWSEEWGDWIDKRCDCGHLNKQGHHRLFYEFIKPSVDKLKIFS